MDELFNKYFQKLKDIVCYNLPTSCHENFDKIYKEYFFKRSQSNISRLANYKDFDKNTLRYIDDLIRHNMKLVTSSTANNLRYRNKLENEYNRMRGKL